MRGLLYDLLDVARITKGEIQLQKSPQDLRAIVEFGIENQRSRIDSEKQRLNIDMPGEPVIVTGDAVRLQQVFGNLLHNASKYTGAGGLITVSLGSQNDSAVLRIRDNGLGIAPEQLEWIFGLFTQANQTLARTERGLGVGLTVARRLAELHGGSLYATSEGLGRGSEFVITLPLSKTKELSTDEVVLPAAATRRRILVVEDNDDGREMLASALRLQGHEVFEAATGRAGIEQACLHTVDVVLVDIGLPDISGYDVAHAFVAQRTRACALLQSPTMAQRRIARNRKRRDSMPIC